MALDRFAAYILTKNIKMSPVLSSKMAQKKGLKNAPIMFFFVFVLLQSSSFPPKRARNAVSTRKSRQQTGLKAIWHPLGCDLPMGLQDQESQNN